MPESGRSWVHLQRYASKLCKPMGKVTIHQAKKLASTLAHYDGQLQFHLLPAHCGHHLNPIEGFWRVMKDTIGAGRCFRTLHQLYWRTRQVLMAHQERPIYEFHW